MSRTIIIDPEFHACIPPLRPEEFAQLEANILEDGIIAPLMIWDNILIDGHNRYAIWQKHSHLKFETKSLSFGDRKEALLWINEHQLGRRNLTDDQRAIVANEARELQSQIVVADKLKKARAVKGGSSIMEADSASIEKKPKRKDRTRKAIATKYELSEKKLRHAQRIKKADPNVYGMVRARTITLNEGNKLVALPKDRRLDAIKAVNNGTDVRTAVREAKKKGYNARIKAAKLKPLEGKYRIFYADPPWKYHGLNQADEYGHAEAHYKCLDDNQLIEFKPDGKRLIKDLADDNAVLFLWTTAPLLERCFSIIEAWGFQYKANFVWDKIDHVMGFYNSVRHEHLLIATKGSCTPDQKKLFDSVQSIKRTEHSCKPYEFYDIIETLYDHGRKLEIFARTKRDGWDSVGNEV